MAADDFGATAYSEVGEGPALVLVHGLGLNRNMWQWQVDALKSHFRVVTYDLLGHGESDNPMGAVHISDMIGQLRKLMDSLAIERCGLIGFSLGGLIAQAFTLEHQDQVQALVILNAAHARTREQRDAIMMRVRQAKDAGPSATVDDALARWFTPECAAEQPQLLDRVRTWVADNDPDIYPQMYELLALADQGLETRIEAIECETLVMTGELDHGNSPAMARKMAEIIPNGRAEILPGLKHMALMERPEVVHSFMFPFLQENLTR